MVDRCRTSPLFFFNMPSVKAGGGVSISQNTLPIIFYYTPWIAGRVSMLYMFCLKESIVGMVKIMVNPITQNKKNKDYVQL